MVKFTYYLLVVLAIMVVAGQGWAFYFASCQQVKEYYYLIQTPGRCL